MLKDPTNFLLYQWQRGNVLACHARVPGSNPDLYISFFRSSMPIKMIKMAKRHPRRAMTVLKPCGNAFSAQKPIWDPSWIEKPLN